VTLRRALIATVAAAFALSGGMAVAYGPGDGLVTLVLLCLPGISALLVAGLAVRHRIRLGPLRRQFNFASAILVAHLIPTLAVGAVLMFFSTHDAILALVIVSFAGVVMQCTTRLVVEGPLQDIARLNRTLVQVGDGARRAAPMPAAQDEIAALTRAANLMIGRLADMERGRRDLVAALSHDLRTPITSLRLLAEAVDDGVVDGEESTRYLREMRTHVGVLSGLIDDLFELSRLEAGDVAWAVEQVRLDELLGGAVEAMRPQAEARMVHVLTQLEHDRLVAQGNVDRLQRVLFNLIQNAIRHTPPDGSVTVSARMAADGVEVEVADTGPGIPAPERGRVFEPFFRGDASRSADGAGAGLGLAIARAIVEAHGGRIWLAEAVAGTRVRFSLPVLPAKAPG